MGRRRAEEPEELDDDLDEAERGETEDEAEELQEPARARPARAKPAPQAARATPEQTRALDLRIFDAADQIEAKLGRAPKQLEIADAAKVPGTPDAQRVRVAKALRRRGLLETPARRRPPPAAAEQAWDAELAAYLDDIGQRGSATCRPLGSAGAAPPAPPAAQVRTEARGGETEPRPSHYNSHPSGVECWAIIEHFSFAVGSAIKYCWRAGLKSHEPIADLRKAKHCIEREIARLARLETKGGAS